MMLYDVVYMFIHNMTAYTANVFPCCRLHYIWQHTHSSMSWFASFLSVTPHCVSLTIKETHHYTSFAGSAQANV